jgi:hypothetical protein
MEDVMVEYQIDFSYVPKSKICLCKELMKECRCMTECFIPYIVETPKPYLINLSFYKNDKVKKLIIKKIKNQVDILLTVLKELRITIADAINNDYSLNETTKLKLLFIAWEQNNNNIKIKLNKLCF